MKAQRVEAFVLEEVARGRKQEAGHAGPHGSFPSGTLQPMLCDTFPTNYMKNH